MFEQFKRVQEIFKQAKPKLAAYLESSAIEELEQEIILRSNNAKPVIMVYGVYNAGKSTLINALAGKELAAVGDIPLTDRVDCYDLGEILLYDTPGIDAPIEHENISHAQLKKSDAVVFVLSSDGALEERKTYEEIGNILRAKKPLLVVINNKSAYLPSDASYVQLIEKFRQNLAQHFVDEPSLSAALAEVNDYLVNAKSAFKAKRESKSVLLENSQLPVVERAISRLFKQTDSAQIAKTLAMQLQGLLQQAIEKAEQGQRNEELIRLQEFIAEIQDCQQRIKERSVLKVNNDKAVLKTNLNELLNSGQEKEANAYISQWQEEISQFFQQEVERGFSHLDQEATQIALLLQAQIIQGEAVVNEEKQFGFETLFSVFVKSGSKLNITEELAKESIIYGLKQGKAMLPQLFKGIGPKTMGKWAGKATPFIGPAIDALVGLYDYYKANEAEQRQLNNARKRQEVITLKITNLVDDMCNRIESSVEHTLTEYFQPLISTLSAELERLSKENRSVDSDISQLKELQNYCKDV